MTKPRNRKIKSFRVHLYHKNEPYIEFPLIITDCDTMVAKEGNLIIYDGDNLRYLFSAGSWTYSTVEYEEGDTDAVEEISD